MSSQTSQKSQNPAPSFDQDLEKAESCTAIPAIDQSQSPDEDDSLVWWDGPDDPANPQNWSTRKKWLNIGLCSAITFVTPLASSMFAPGVPEVLETFNSSSRLLSSFVVSVFVLGFAIGPLIIAPLSEIYGRLPLYHVGNVGFFVFTIACAVADSMGMLIAFRLLSGCFGVTCLTIGAGTIADTMPTARRGRAMAIWTAGPLFGPVVGPVAGGFLVQAMGWRWVFWLLTILSGVLTVVCMVFMRETYAPAILNRKVARLRKETGNPNLRSKLAKDTSHKELIIRAIVRPIKLLVRSPIVLAMSSFIAIIYALLYLLFSTFSFVFGENYGFGSGTVGLSYIGIGIGMFIGLVLVGQTSDRLIGKLQAAGKPTRPEDRLPVWLVGPAALCIPVGLFIYGWTTEKRIHWAVPMFGTLIIGVGLLSCMLCIQTYLVDAFTIHASSAMAANTLVRSTLGATLPLCALEMYDALGLGWGNSILAFIALAVVPVPVLFSLYGERIRKRSANVQF
ncbi:Efflux pump rdc3 [Lasiodiplodia theobromae]|uniref:Efflux pump rdc3 n=1 Tax=Lasiodiplodia theobromae TaxID=45133 RepID=A0A5N5D7K2_9PEZI|nr:Efflux pump rdc3 [Lasiodiplodia theobromae]